MLQRYFIYGLNRRENAATSLLLLLRSTMGVLLCLESKDLFLLRTRSRIDKKQLQKNVLLYSNSEKSRVGMNPVAIRALVRKIERKKVREIKFTVEVPCVIAPHSLKRMCVGIRIYTVHTHTHIVWCPPWTISVCHFCPPERSSTATEKKPTEFDFPSRRKEGKKLLASSKNSLGDSQPVLQSIGRRRTNRKQVEKSYILYHRSWKWKRFRVTFNEALFSLLGRRDN